MTRCVGDRDPSAPGRRSARRRGPVAARLAACLRLTTPPTWRPIFLRLHPDWKTGQADAVRSTCTSPDRDVFVAVVDDRPVGFVAVALDAYHPRMGAVDMIAVDPEYQRRGIAREMMAFAADHMRRSGMDIAVVETGGDPGHAPARHAYESAGYTLLPITRYFQLLHEDR